MSPFSADESSRSRFASRWIRLGDPAPEALRDARRQLHWAVQLLAAFGDACLFHRPDGSHRAVTWSPERRAFLSGRTADGSRLRLGLQPGDFAYRLFESGPTPSQSFELRGRTIAQAAEWLRAALTPGRDGSIPTVAPDGSGIPDHPVGRGAAFDAGPAELSELERWFHDGFLLLGAVAAVEEGASEVLCWPRSFDISIVIDLDAGAEEPVSPDDSRSIEISMTPGDESYPDPYWRVSPWPYPDTSVLPGLPPPAVWHTAGWVGAVLTASDLLASGDDLAQAGRAASFVRASIAACRGLLRR